MLLGRDVILLTIEDAVRLITLVQDGSCLTKEQCVKLQKLGCLDLYERLVEAVGRMERDG
jgi:hypothetical protein